jgi:hypothetical protein
MNQHHFEDATKLVGHPVADSYTMNAFQDVHAGEVTLQCFWCNYKAIVDVRIRPLQVKQFSGKYHTFRHYSK